MTSARSFRLPALLAALALTSCLGGDNAAGPTIPSAVSLSIQPTFPPSAALAAADINVIRIRVYSDPEGELLSTEELSVDPTADSWTIDVVFELGSSETTSVVLEIELVNRSPTGVETVEWSARAGPFSIEPGSSTDVRRVEVQRGPLDNLSVSGISILPDPTPVILVGGTLPLSVQVTTSSSTVSPVVFWSSLDPSVALVGEGGVVTGVAEGTARIVAEAGSHADTADVTVRDLPQSVDLAVAKDVDHRSPLPGDTVVFEVRVRNRGSGDATGASVRDTLPSGLTFVSASATRGSYDPETGIWTVGDLSAGGSDTLRVRAVVAMDRAGQSLENVAWLLPLPDQTDSQAANDTARASVSVGFREADLSVRKEVDEAEALEGETVTFTITVRNGGPLGATGVQVLDSLPDGFTLVSASPDQGSWDPGTGVWSVGDLAASDSATLVLVAQVAEGTAGRTLTNVARSLGSEFERDSDPGNDEASASVSVNQPATNLAVTKSVDVSEPLEGDTVEFVVAVENLGTNEATSVQILDLLPAGLTLVEATASSGTYDTGTGLWSLDQLPVGGRETLTISARVDSGTSGNTLTNTAQLHALTERDSDDSDDAGSASVTIPGVTLVVTTEPTRTPAGEPISTIRLQARDDGGDPVPYNGLVTASVESGPGTLGGTTSRQALSGEVSFDDLTLSQPGTYRLRFSGPGVSDAVSAEFEVFSQVDIAVEKSVDAAEPPQGGQVIFSVTVTNNGPAGATGLRVEDQLPAGLTFSSATPTTGSFNSGTGEWSIGALAAGGSEILLLYATVDDGTAGQTITNSAGVTHVDQEDTSADNDQDSTTLTVRSVDVQVTKTVDNENPVGGETVTFTVTATDNGPYPATGLEVTDVLPAGLTFSGSEASQGTYNAETGVWSIGTLLTDASATLTITATVDSGTAGDTLVNTATRTATNEGDINSANDTASASVMPLEHPVARTYTTAGNTQLVVGGYAAPTTPHATDANNLLVGTPLLTAHPGTYTTTNGGSVTIAANGDFIYTPAVGDPGPDTFMYTVQTDESALVTINITGMVWYVDNTAGTTGTGESNDPFDQWFDSYGATTDSDGSTVYIHRGDGTSTGYEDVNPHVGQTVVGEGVELMVGALSLAPAGTAPVLSSTEGPGLNLNDGVTVKGVDIVSPAFGSGIGAYGLTGGATVDQVNITTPDNSGIEISGSSGTFTFTNIDIDRAALAAVRVSGGSAVVNVGIVPGSITNTAGRVLEVTNTTGGSVTLTGGDINDTGTGVRISGNAGSVSVSNALTITNPTDTALVVQNNTGAVTIDSLDITTTDQIPIYTYNNSTGTITLEGTVRATGTTGRVDVQLNSSPMAVVFDTLVVSNTSGTGGALAMYSLTNASTVEIGYLNVGATGYPTIYGQEHGTLRITDPTSGVVGAGTQAWYTSVGEGVGISALDVTLGTLVSIASTSGGVYISDATGSFTATGGSIVEPAYDGFDVTNGTADVTYGGTITDPGINAAVVQFQSAGTVTFSGAISQNVGALGRGIIVSNSSGGTVNFTGGINVATTSFPAFRATNGGTINVTGTNVVASTTASAAIAFTGGSTIGAGGVTFQSVSKTGGISGISLNGTGSTGVFAVTGFGSTDGSGGTITNTSGAGVSLTNVDGVVLKNMNILNSGTDGIAGDTVANLTLDNDTLTDTSGSTGDQGIQLDVLTGTSAITNSHVVLAPEHAVLITVPTGTLNLDLTGSTFTGAGTGDGFNIAVTGTGSATVTADGSAFDTNASDGFYGSSDDGSTLTFYSKNGTTFNDNSGAGLILTDLGSVVNFDIRGSTVSGNTYTGVGLVSDTGSTAAGGLNGTFDSNMLESASLGYALSASLQGHALNRVAFTNNTVTLVPGDGENGVRFFTGGTYPTGLDLIVEGNVFDLSAVSSDTALDVQNASGATCVRYGAGGANSIQFDGSGTSTGVNGTNSGGTFNVEDLGSFADLLTLMTARTLVTGTGLLLNASGTFTAGTCSAPTSF